MYTAIQYVHGSHILEQGVIWLKTQEYAQRCIHGCQFLSHLISSVMTELLIELENSGFIFRYYSMYSRFVSVILYMKAPRLRLRCLYSSHIDNLRRTQSQLIHQPKFFFRIYIQSL